jgi:hypothetical protein
MSGFEVAGIVLGVIPIVISALEDYDEGLTAIQRWRKYEREVRSLIRNLETERLRLQTICEKLLIGIAPPSRIEHMINDPTGSLWHEEDIQKKINARLWKSAQNYDETLQEMRKAIDEMMDRIKPNSVPSILDFKRVAFALKRSRYAELLATIEKGNSTLENLTDRNIELEPKRRVRSQGKFLEILRDISRSLYKALRASAGCTCQHNVSLQLESRSADIGPLDGEEHVLRNVSFRIAVSYDKDTSSIYKVGQSWEEVLATVISPPKTRSPLHPPTPSRPQKVKIKGKSVSFTLSQPKIATVSSTATLTETILKSTTSDLVASFPPSNGSGTAVVGEQREVITTDLCVCLERAQKHTQNECYGTIASPGGRTFALYPAPVDRWVKDHHIDETWSVCSLREALSRTDQTEVPYLSYRDRLRLAVIVSSSMLQLFNTPWLSETLSCGEIFFLKKGGYSQYERASIIKRLSEDANTSSRLPVGGQPFELMRNATLLSLGILLIELKLGKALQSLRTPPEESVAVLNPTFADYMTAQRLLPDIHRASTNYGSAVQRCIDGDLHQQGVGLEDEDLRQEVYAGIVALLEKDLESI